MNIGKRKKRNEEEFIPEWKKRCTVINLDCKYCLLYDKDIKWCSHHMDEYREYLKQGKKIRKA